MTLIAGILYDTDTQTGYIIESGTPQWVALLDWLRFHNLDPDVVVRGTTVIRDAPRCRITYEAFTLDAAGLILFDDAGTDAQTQTQVEQGEAPPLPIPEIITQTCRYTLTPTPPHC